MTRNSLALRLAGFLAAAILAAPNANAASTYSTTAPSGSEKTTDNAGNCNASYQSFQLKADWLFLTGGDDLASSAEAASLDSVTVHWGANGHSGATFGHSASNGGTPDASQPTPYLVVTTPQNVIVAVSSAGDNAAWTASGSSTFTFSGAVIATKAQYRYHFVSSIEGLFAGSVLESSAAARCNGKWHGPESAKVSDSTVCIDAAQTYSIETEFTVSAADASAASVLAATAEGVSLASGEAPVFVVGGTAGGVVNVSASASVPALTVVGEATTLKLTDSLSASYLYLPATTTLDASAVVLSTPATDGETSATTTLVSGGISSASVPAVTLPDIPSGYAATINRADGGISVTLTKETTYSGSVESGGTLVWSQVRPAGWIDNEFARIAVEIADSATFEIDTALVAGSLTVTGSGSVTVKRDEGVPVSIASFGKDSGVTSVTFDNFTAVPAFASSAPASDSIYFTGSDTLTDIPAVGDATALATLNVAQPVALSGSAGFNLVGSENVNFNEGSDASFSRFVLGNESGVTQTVTQNGGEIAVTGSVAPESNGASILLGHWSSTVNLATKGGTFTALNAVSRLGWDGSATWAIGNGDGEAMVKVKGIATGGNGHTGAGALNLFPNGVLELGDGGIKMQNSAGTVNLAGGKIKATADTAIDNNKTAGGAILNENTTTTIDTDGYVVTLSAPLSGAGTLKKTGTGTLKVTGAGSSTALHEIDGGTLLLSGDGASLGSGGVNLKGDGSRIDIEPGSEGTITIAGSYLINSSQGNNSPVVNIGAGTVENNATGVYQTGQFAGADINVNEGGTLKLNVEGQLGYAMYSSLSVNAGGTLALNAQQKLSRSLKLNGGEVTLGGVAVPLVIYGERTVAATADSSITAVASEAAADPAIWIDAGPLTFNVSSADATLALAAPIADGSSATYVGKEVRKTGAGTLKLTKASTATGTLTASAGTLELDGGSWAGPVVVGENAALNVVSASKIADGELIASGSFTVSGAVKVNGGAVAYEIRDGGIYKATPVAYVTITVPAVENATATVTVDGETVAANEDGTYSVVAGSTVTVTYAANDGYALSGTATYTIDSAAEDTTLDASETTAAPVVATFNRVSYTTLEAAVAAWKRADVMVAYQNPVVLQSDVSLSSALEIPVNDNAAAVPMAINGNSRTITGDVVVGSGATLKPTSLTITGDVTVGGTLVSSTGGDGVVVNGSLSFVNGGLQGTFSATAAGLAVNGAVSVAGTLTLSGDVIASDAGKYKVVSGTTITLSEGAAIVMSDNPGWAYDIEDDGDAKTLVVSAAVALVDGEYYDAMEDAVAVAKAGGKVLTLLANAGTFTLSTGETLKVKKGVYDIDVRDEEGAAAAETGPDDDGVTTYTANSYAARLTVGSTASTPFESVEAAFAALADYAGMQTGCTITLLDDATLSQTVTVPAFAGSYRLTLDLGGHTLTGPADGYAISNSGRLTISNGSISAEGIVENTASGASATIQSGTYSASDDAAFSAVDGSTITVKAGVVFTTDIDSEYCETGYATRAVTDADGVTTYVVSEDKGWIYEDKDYPGYTGTWTTEVVYDDDGRVAIEDSNTYTPAKASAGELVTVSLTMSFDAERDDEDALEDGAQAGIRLGPDSTFQIYTLVDADGTETAKWLDVAADGVTPATETDYTFKFTLDYNAKTYTVAVVDGETERALASGETTAFPLADKTKTSVSRLDFDGSGTVTSITGSYEDAEVPTEKFNDGDDVEVEDGKITLDDKQAKWLNSYGDYAAVKEAIAALDAKTFNDAYLLNLDVTADEFSYEFDVTDIEVGDTTVKVTATLTRTGARTADGAALPINGTLKLLGSAELAPDTFTEQGTAEVDDGKMSSGSATLTFPIPAENPPTFFTATIE